MLDELSFLGLVAERDNHILCVERPVFEDSDSSRHKMLRVFPNLHLPKWVERRIHSHEPHLDIHYLLSKPDMVERVWCESKLGTLEGEICYQAAEATWTRRHAAGVINCDKPLVGGFIERLFHKNILGIQELEANILRERFDGEKNRNLRIVSESQETVELQEG